MEEGETRSNENKSLGRGRAHETDGTTAETDLISFTSKFVLDFQKYFHTVYNEPVFFLGSLLSSTALVPVLDNNDPKKSRWDSKWTCS